jgi:hypothetical protein
MARIFISYRRADTSGYVIAIYNELLKSYSAEQLFRDLNTIDYGADFVETIQAAVWACDVQLVIIGPQWLSVSDKDGTRRLDDPHDFVRLEIESALERDIAIIPVLVGGAVMPTEDELPGGLKRLARRNAMELDDRDFSAHIQRLQNAIQRAVEQVEADRKRDSERKTIITIPLPQWCAIPPGEVTILDKTYPVEKIRMAKCPITVDIYDYFVSGGGYQEAKFWTDQGWQWRVQNNITQPRFWDDAALREPNFPIVGVSWFEAVAFTHWFSTNTLMDVRLPSEPEWQRAAQGDDDRLYPWGAEFDPQRCNTMESGVGGLTRVDLYSNGVSPYGVYDLIGNTWEWCLNHWDETQVGDTDPQGDLRRVVRGGCWDGDVDLANNHFRGRFKADTRNRFIGFRVVFGAF